MAVQICVFVYVGTSDFVRTLCINDEIGINVTQGYFYFSKPYSIPAVWYPSTVGCDMRVYGTFNGRQLLCGRTSTQIRLVKLNGGMQM